MTPVTVEGLLKEKVFMTVVAEILVAEGTGKSKMQEPRMLLHVVFSRVVIYSSKSRMAAFCCTYQSIDSVIHIGKSSSGFVK